MSHTLTPDDDTGKTAQARDSSRGASVQVTSDMNAGTERGYVVLDCDGEFLAWSSCVLVAKRRCDQDPLADRVESARGDLMSYAPRSKRREMR